MMLGIKPKHPWYVAKGTSEDEAARDAAAAEEGEGKLNIFSEMTVLALRLTNCRTSSNKIVFSGTSIINMSTLRYERIDIVGGASNLYDQTGLLRRITSCFIRCTGRAASLFSTHLLILTPMPRSQ